MTSYSGLSNTAATDLSQSNLSTGHTSFLKALLNNPLTRGAAIAGACIGSLFAENANADLIVHDTMTDFSGNAVANAQYHFWDRAFAPASLATGIIGTPVTGLAGYQVGRIETALQFAQLNENTNQYEFVTGPINLANMNLSFRAFYVPDAQNFSVENIEDGVNVFFHDFSYSQLLAGSGNSLGVIGGRESYYFGIDTNTLNWGTVDNQLGMVGIIPFYTDYETNFDLNLLSGMTLSSNSGMTTGISDLARFQFGGDSVTTLQAESGFDHGINRVSFTSSIPEPSSMPLVLVAGIALSLVRIRSNENNSYSLA